MPVEYVDWLTNHFHPRDVEGDDVSFDDVLSVFDDRFGVKESKRYAALKFFSSKFMQGEETIDDWVIDLERWVSKCNFVSYLETAIINQLVIGVPDVRLQLDLTDDDTLTKGQLLARIKHWDQTWREAATLQKALPSSSSAPLAPSPVLAVSSSVFEPARKPSKTIPRKALFCDSCGGRHERRTRKHRHAVCYHCSKPGHLASVCRTASQVSAAVSAADAGQTATLGYLSF